MGRGRFVVALLGKENVRGVVSGSKVNKTGSTKPWGVLRGLVAYMERGCFGMKLSAGQLVGLPRCPCCGVAQPVFPQLWSTDAIAGEDGSPGRAWGTFQCRTCGSVVLAEGGRGASLANANVEKIFPSLRSVDEAVPARARNYLQQAHETLHAPDAAAVMAASAVDAMLKEKGYTEGTLYTRIDKAVENHLLTEDMGRWAHSVRLEANRPRHADEEDPHVTDDEAKQAVEFTRALAEFLFVIPARVQKGLEKAAEAGA